MPAIPFVSLRYSASERAELERAFQRVVASGVYLRGEETRGFEAEFAEFTGRNYCVAVGNGLDALTLVLMAWKQMYGWDNGDEVIVSGHTFYASWLSIARAGLKPVGCDARGDGFLIDESLIEKLITKRTRALLPVHLYGEQCNMTHIMQIARSRQLKVLCDSAQCHRRAQEGDTGADAEAFSFYPTKNLGALGDAGAVTTDDAELARMVRRKANYGGDYSGLFAEQGINSRIDEMQAALLRVKLRWVSKQTRRRQQIAQRYIEGLNNPLVSIPTHASGADATRFSTFHIFPILCHERNQLQRALQQHNIATAVHYPIPPHKQPLFCHTHQPPLPRTEEIADQELSLPIYHSLSDDETDYIIEQINKFSL